MVKIFKFIILVIITSIAIIAMAKITGTKIEEPSMVLYTICILQIGVIVNIITRKIDGSN